MGKVFEKTENQKTNKKSVSFFPFGREAGKIHGGAVMRQKKRKHVTAGRNIRWDVISPREKAKTNHKNSGDVNLTGVKRGFAFNKKCASLMGTTLTR